MYSSTLPGLLLAIDMLSRGQAQRGYRRILYGLPSIRSSPLPAITNAQTHRPSESLPHPAPGLRTHCRCWQWSRRRTFDLS